MTDGVDPESVKQMDRLRRIMDGDEEAITESANSSDDTSAGASWDPNNTPAGVSGQEVDWMQNIMNRFEGKTENAAQELAEETRYNQQLNEAMDTERTKNGARIGSWEIQQDLMETTSGRSKKVYSVINTKTGEPIAKDILVYEGALGLVKLFNKGYTLTDSDVREILKLEENFSHAYYNAAQHKSKAKNYNKKGNANKADLHESRFDASRQNALQLKDQLKKKIKRL